MIMVDVVCLLNVFLVKCLTGRGDPGTDPRSAAVTHHDSQVAHVPRKIWKNKKAQGLKWPRAQPTHTHREQNT